MPTELGQLSQLKMLDQSRDKLKKMPAELDELLCRENCPLRHNLLAGSMPAAWQSRVSVSLSDKERGKNHLSFRVA